MTPVRVDFAARNNAPWQDAVPLKFTTEDGVVTDFDFGDYAPLQMQIKAEEFTPLAEIDVTDSDHLSVEPDGALGIDIPENLMAPLVGTYWYDLRGTSGSDHPVIMYGYVTIAQGTTYT